MRLDVTPLAASAPAPRSRVLAHVGLFWVGYVAVLVMSAQLKHMVPAALGPLVWGLASCALLFPASYWLLRWEGRRLSDVGLNLQARSFLRLLQGVLVALAAFAVILGVVAWLAGGLRFQRGIMLDPGTILLSLSTILALACMEELGFRGYALRTLSRAMGLWPSQLVVAIAFGLCHIAFGWPWASVLLGVIPSAILFGVCALRSGGLAMPLGVHAGLNLAQWLWSPAASGVWQVVVAESAQELVSRVGQPIGAVVTLVAAWLVWRWRAGAQAEVA